MVTPLWEWAMPRDGDGGCVGVPMTRHGAMEALTKALIRTERPGDRNCLLPSGVHSAHGRRRAIAAHPARI